MKEPSKFDYGRSDDTRFTLIERVKQQYDEKAWKEFAEIYKGYIYAVIRGIKKGQSKNS